MSITPLKQTCTITFANALALVVDDVDSAAKILGLLDFRADIDSAARLIGSTPLDATGLITNGNVLTITITGSAGTNSNVGLLVAGDIVTIKAASLK